MDENAKHAVRLLAARLPSWIVWYGQHTGHFWALPRTCDLAAAPHIESRTPAQLERQAQEIERNFRARGVSPPATPASGPSRSRAAEARS
ncbi:hypothetical protein [Planotetraspora sp. GP83]|uniref:hypothetical protein n=1 Tax=Planotetraspora sp. GP83 TaxID=3156264 RepID=UPI003516EBCB